MTPRMIVNQLKERARRRSDQNDTPEEVTRPPLPVDLGLSDEKNSRSPTSKIATSSRLKESSSPELTFAALHPVNMKAVQPLQVDGQLAFSIGSPDCVDGAIRFFEPRLLRKSQVISSEPSRCVSRSVNSLPSNPPQANDARILLRLESDSLTTDDTGARVPVIPTHSGLSKQHRMDQFWRARGPQRPDNFMLNVEDTGIAPHHLQEQMRTRQSPQRPPGTDHFFFAPNERSWVPQTAMIPEFGQFGQGNDWSSSHQPFVVMMPENGLPRINMMATPWLANTLTRQKQPARPTEAYPQRGADGFTSQLNQTPYYSETAEHEPPNSPNDDRIEIPVFKIVNNSPLSTSQPTHEPATSSPVDYTARSFTLPNRRRTFPTEPFGDKPAPFVDRNRSVTKPKQHDQFQHTQLPNQPYSSQSAESDSLPVNRGIPTSHYSAQTLPVMRGSVEPSSVSIPVHYTTGSSFPTPPPRYTQSLRRKPDGGGGAIRINAPKPIDVRLVPPAGMKPKEEGSRSRPSSYHEELAPPTLPPRTSRHVSELPRGSAHGTDEDGEIPVFKITAATSSPVPRFTDTLPRPQKSEISQNGADGKSRILIGGDETDHVPTRPKSPRGYLQTFLREARARSPSPARRSTESPSRDRGRDRKSMRENEKYRRNRAPSPMPQRKQEIIFDDEIDWSEEKEEGNKVDWQQLQAVLRLVIAPV